MNIVIDCTPIPKKYDKETIENICAWAMVTLQKKQEAKWYNKIGINPFAHFFPSDLDILMKAREEELKNLKKK